jgi:hypothetical protein
MIRRFALIATVLVSFSAILKAQTAKAPPAEYKFKLGVNYEMSRGKAAENKNEVSYLFSEGNYTGITMGDQGMLIVYDLDKKMMITFMQQQKMYMIMDFDKIRQKAEEMSKDAGQKTPSATDTKITKTGKTETILGYKCEQYQVTGKNSNMLVWITTELGANYGNFMQGMSAIMKGGNMGAVFPEVKGMANGVMLKMETTDSSNNNSMQMVAKSINKEGLVFKTAGYKGMAMPGQ